MSATVATPLPGEEIIGSGYDVLNGLYADSSSCQTNLFSFPEETKVVMVGTKSFTMPKVLSFHGNGSVDVSVYTGENISEYLRSMTSQTKIEGKYNFFSASVSVDIGESSFQRAENHFSQVKHRVGLYTIQLPANHKQYLSPMVKDDIDNAKDLDYLFDSYGTHYLNGIVMGGRATYSAVTNKFDYKANRDYKMVAKMSYDNLVGSISAEEALEYKEDINQFNATSRRTLHTLGGDPEFAGDNFPKEQEKWRKSILDYVSFVDFMKNNSLIGIWNLASTPERSKQLRDYFHVYCEKNQKKFDIPEGPVLRAKIVPLSKVQYTDSGSRAKQDLTVCIPDIGDDWYYLGQVAYQGGGARGHTLAVQELVPGSGALGDVDRWEHVWNDSGSGRSKDYNLWRGVAQDPVNYVVLSDFFRGGVDNQNPPSKDEAAGIKAVRVDCLTPAKVGSEVWSDRGTGAHQDGSVWNIDPVDESVSINMNEISRYYVASGSHGHPDRTLYVLRKDKVVFRGATEVVDGHKSAAVEFKHN